MREALNFDMTKSAKLSSLTASVRTESPRRSKFAKFMTNHIFCDINWKKLLTIMDCDGMPNKFRCNSRTSRPRANDTFTT